MFQHQPHTKVNRKRPLPSDFKIGTDTKRQKVWSNIRCKFGDNCKFHLTNLKRRNGHTRSEIDTMNRKRMTALSKLPKSKSVKDKLNRRAWPNTRSN